MITFKNRTALITGAANGIGYATAEKLGEYGVSLALLDIQEQQLWQIQEAMERRNVKIKAYVCDVTDEQCVSEVVKDALQKFGGIDILINSAGIYRGDVLFAQSTSENWKRKIDVNILGTMYATRAIINSMLAQHYGRIINLGSVTGVYGKAMAVDYSMTKGAINSFTKALGKEVAQYGITVNTVSPGSIRVRPEDNQPDMNFLGRWGTPKECAELICFLTSDGAGYICGQNYQVDGLRKKM